MKHTSEHTELSRIITLALLEARLQEERCYGVHQPMMHGLREETKEIECPVCQRIADLERAIAELEREIAEAQP